MGPISIMVTIVAVRERGDGSIRLVEDNNVCDPSNENVMFRVWYHPIKIKMPDGFFISFDHVLLSGDLKFATMCVNRHDDYWDPVRTIKLKPGVKEGFETFGDCVPFTI